MNPDTSIVLWLDQFAGRWETADAFIRIASDNPLVQAAVPVTILWYFWFRNDTQAAVRRTRELIITTLAAGSVGVLLARGLTLLLPFRTRPFATPSLDYRIVHAEWYAGLHGWSSFPSDHAVLFFALATGITLISRRIGVLMLFYAALIDCLPRVYLGVHYPSDIVVGAILGSLIVLLAARDSIRTPFAGRIYDWAERYPGLVYAGLFLCMFEVATMFDSALQLAEASAMLMLSVYRHADFVQALIVYLLVCGLPLIGGYLLASRRTARSGLRSVSTPKPHHR